MVVGVADAVPEPQDDGDERALELHGAASPGRRCRRSSSTACSSARARTRGSATARGRVGRQGPQGRRARQRDGRPRLRAGEGAGRGEGLDEVFRAAGFDWRGAGCSMCLGMNPDIAAPGGACASTSEPQLEGRQGKGGPLAPRLSRGWRPRPRSRATSSTSGPGSSWKAIGRHRARVGARCATTSTPPDHPQAVPQAGGATGFGEFLFYDWAKEPDWDLPVNQVLVAAGTSAAARSREHAPWALRGLRVPRDHRAVASPTSSGRTARR